MAQKVLIAGAGIAGCCLAWWLDTYGYEVTVVEQAPEPRQGGYVIDFWGLGYEVAARMGLVDELRAQDLAVEEFRIVDRTGRKVSGIDQRAMGELTGGRILSLPRSAVALTLYRAVKDRVAVRFGKGVTGVVDGPEGVEVRFSEGAPERYDLVIGADGLHSAVREAALGRQDQFEHYLGYCVAAFTTTGYGHRNPHTYVAYGEPGRQIWRITLGEDATLFLLVFAEADPAAVPVQDRARQREVIARRYADAGWEAPEMLRALATASDVYVDRVSQIIMPHWTTGRVALVGDACACPSLLAGEGASMAMAEAYTLAGELDAAGGDHTRAFAAYERRLRPYVERKQKGARAFANSFVPRTALGLWARNAAINAATGLGLTRLLFRAQLADPMELGRYGAG